MVLPVGALTGLEILSKRSKQNIQQNIILASITTKPMGTMEEDTEFRDLIIKKLENNGVLLKMKVSKTFYTLRPCGKCIESTTGSSSSTDLQSSGQRKQKRRLTNKFNYK